MSVLNATVTSSDQARIRFATAEDVPAILAISNWAAEHTPANFAVEPETLEHWQDSFRQTSAMYPWLVAEQGDASSRDAGKPMIVGFAKASPHRARCAYAWTAELTVYIHPDHHGRGVGKALYGKLVPILKAQGYRTLLAGITVPNAASERLHESLGMKRVAVFTRVGWKFGRWHDVGFWELEFDAAGGPPGQIKPVASVTGEWNHG